jgi:hypothetical protein
MPRSRASPLAKRPRRGTTRPEESLLCDHHRRAAGGRSLRLRPAADLAPLSACPASGARDHVGNASVGRSTLTDGTLRAGTLRRLEGRACRGDLDLPSLAVFGRDQPKGVMLAQGNLMANSVAALTTPQLLGAVAGCCTARRCSTSPTSPPGTWVSSWDPPT